MALEIIIKPPNVGAHLRPDVGVGRHRRATLVLIPLAGQIRAEGDVNIRQKFFELLGGGFFMGRVDIGIHEKNRHRLDAKFFDFIGELFQRRRIERRDHFAFAAHPLGDFEAQLARNQGLVALIMQIEGIGPVAAGDFENVAKALARHQRSLRAFALDQRIDDQRRAVIDQRRFSRFDLGFVETVENSLDQIIVGGRALRINDSMGFVIEGD